MRDFWDEVAGLDLVLVVPHPDDEIFGLAGIMALAQRQGKRTTILAVTDGEASHARSNRITPGELVELRLREVHSAYAEMGCQPERMRLGLPDGGVSVSQLTLLLDRFANERCALLAPVENDGHPDHDACGRAAAGVASRNCLRLYTYPIWEYHRGAKHAHAPETILRVVLPREQRIAKRRAIECFHSQLTALGEAPEDGPVLQPGFEAPFLAGYEVLYHDQATR